MKCEDCKGVILKAIDPKGKSIKKELKRVSVYTDVLFTTFIMV